VNTSWSMSRSSTGSDHCGTVECCTTGDTTSDETIETFKRLYALLEYAVMHDDEAARIRVGVPSFALASCGGLVRGWWRACSAANLPLSD